MNDWTRIKDALWATGILEARKKEAWRWSALARDWLDANDIDARSVDHGTMQRFVHEVEPVSGTRNPHQRIWAFNLLVEAARAVSPPRARRTGTAVARLDNVAERSPLGKAISRVMARARSEGDRRRWGTCLGEFLGWCAERDLDPLECWHGDIGVFRRERIAAGFNSPGEYVSVANKLLEEIDEVRSGSAPDLTPAR